MYFSSLSHVLRRVCRWCLPASTEDRQDVHKTFLPFPCLSFNMAKWALFPPAYGFPVSLEFPFYQMPTTCLHPMFPWAVLLFFYSVVSWTSPGSVWYQPVLASLGWVDFSGGMMCLELQAGIYYDYWDPRNYTKFLIYTQETGHQNPLQWGFRPRPRKYLAYFFRTLLKNRDSFSEVWSS